MADDKKQDTLCRKWQLTINNPVEYGFTHDFIREKMREFKTCVYYCMADEIGSTYHTHLYIHCRSVIRFSMIKKRFCSAHIEPARGTALQNYEYITKSGKWENDKKHETCVNDTFEEWGDLPVERQGQRNDIADLYSMIKNGMTDYDIMEENPDFLFNLDKIEKARQTYIQERYKNTWRTLDVTYIYGSTGIGKTRGVMEKYGYENVFRVTDYLHPFDNYRGQDVVVFEEYRSNMRIGDMLNYLDGYPLELPCRYTNKFACYTKVYIITNIPLGQQYTQVQLDSYETWLAFLRRINRVYCYHINGKVDVSRLELNNAGFHMVQDNEYIPFEEKENKNDDTKIV